MAADGDDGNNDNDGGMVLFVMRTPVPHADGSGVEE